VEIAALGKATRMGFFHHPGVTVLQAKLQMVVCSSRNDQRSHSLPAYQGKKLSDFYTSQGAVLVDAFLAAT